MEIKEYFKTIWLKEVNNMINLQFAMQSHQTTNTCDNNFEGILRRILILLIQRLKCWLWIDDKNVKFKTF